MMDDHVTVYLCQMTQGVNVETLRNGAHITLMMMS